MLSNLRPAMASVNAPLIKACVRRGNSLANFVISVLSKSVIFLLLSSNNFSGPAVSDGLCLLNQSMGWKLSLHLRLFQISSLLRMILIITKGIWRSIKLLIKVRLASIVI